MIEFANRTLHSKANNASPRILIVRVGAMGDVIHALPAVAVLREALPAAHIGWAIEPRWSSLLRTEGATHRDADCMPLVDAVHPVEAKQWNRKPASLATLQSILALRRELRAHRYDIVVDLQGTLRSAVIARMSGAPSRIGSAAPRESIARRFYNREVPRTVVHVVDQAHELVHAAIAQIATRPGITPHETQRSAIPLLPRDRGAEAEWHRIREQLCANRAPVLLAATAGWGAKEWPSERYAALAAALVDRGECVLLNTAPGGVDAVTECVLQSVQANHPVQARHVRSLPATLPVLTAATREAKAVIAGDTGPLHLAEALGTPTVGLFGPTDPARTGPRRNSVCLRDPASVTDHRRHTETEAGLARIPVDSVLHAFASVTQHNHARY